MQCNAMQSMQPQGQSSSAISNTIECAAMLRHTKCYTMYTRQHEQQEATRSSQEQSGAARAGAARSSWKPGEVTEGGLCTAMQSNATARAMQQPILVDWGTPWSRSPGRRPKVKNFRNIKKTQRSIKNYLPLIRITSP